MRHRVIKPLSESMFTLKTSVSVWTWITCGINRFFFLKHNNQTSLHAQARVTAAVVNHCEKKISLHPKHLVMLTLATASSIHFPWLCSSLGIKNSYFTYFKKHLLNPALTPMCVFWSAIKCVVCKSVAGHYIQSEINSGTLMCNIYHYWMFTWSRLPLSWLI